MFKYLLKTAVRSAIRAAEDSYNTPDRIGARGERKVHNPPLLFNVNFDASEKFNIASEHPGILEQINQLRAKHEANLIRGEDQLAERE